MLSIVHINVVPQSLCQGPSLLAMYPNGLARSVVCPEYKSLPSDLKSTYKEMIPARNTIDAHAQSFVANGEMLLPILRALSQRTHSLHFTRNARCFRSACSCIPACNPQQRKFPILPYIQPLRTAPDTPVVTGFISWSAIHIIH